MGRLLTRLKTLRPVALVLAVQRRYGADSGGFLAAAMTYYGFLSLFPLMLVALAAMGFVLARDEARIDEWTSRIAGAVPGAGTLVGDNLRTVVEHRAGIGIIGLVGLLWSGRAIVKAAAFSLARVFRRSYFANFFKEELWTLAALVAVGTISLLSLGLGGVVGGAVGRSGPLRALGTATTFALDFALFSLSYRILTRGGGPRFRDLWAGALLAAAGWTALKVAGSWYASRTVANAQEVYGSFGAVVGVLVLLYLGARLFLYGAELNAVLMDERRMEHRAERIAA